MRGLTRTLLALLCTIGSLFAAPALAGAYPIVGIGENTTPIFSDPRFLALGITQVRDDIAWNALSVPRARADLTAWLADAQTDGLTPLITFDHVVGSARIEQKLPSVAQFSNAFVKFRKRYPWVTDFETWDEANFYLEGTAFSPKRAAQFYLALRRDCPSCTILASDLLDVPKTEAVPMVKWVDEFMRYAHTQPGYWGLNNYFGANRLEKGTTEQLLHAVKGKIWLAETGGIVSRNNHSNVGFAQGAKHAATVDKFILHTLDRLSPRIQRVYLYDWNAQTPHDKWDSALISWNGVPRPGYDVLANTLDSWGIAPDCAISKRPPACAVTGGPAAALLRF
ncbi:MAG TPA: hypothetical protein VHM72_05240 [Solirubrobacteraceae bacterium]|nr:hypothetical protein [Solirubrobacteraceae bacterium]